MSHFSVMVVTKTQPNKEELGRILQPWHEYECTGVDDEYVVDVDKTDEALEEFGKPKTVVVLAGGRVISRWDNELYTGEPDKDDFGGRKTFVLPAGAEEREMPAEEARAHGAGYATLEDCAKDYFGGFVRDGRVFNRTNPNKKWDWWQIGGRYSGLFAPNYDPDKDPDNIEYCQLCLGTGKREDMACVNGCNGCQGTGRSVKWPTQWKAVGSQVRRADLPLEALRTASELRAVATWQKYQKIVAGRSIPDWNHLRDTLGVEKAREVYNGFQVIKDLCKAGCDSWSEMEDLLKQQPEIAAQARARAVSTYALVHDGKWYQRGEMGWWGMASNEMDRGEWDRQFGQMFDELAPSDWLTVVDCHI